MSLHRPAWRKKAWQPGSGSVFHPAIAPRAAPLSPAALPTPPRRTAGLEVPAHPRTSSPPGSISSPGLPPSTWQLPEGISRSCKHTSHAAPRHFQFPEVLFFQRDNLSPYHALTSSSLHPQAVLSPFHPPLAVRMAVFQGLLPGLLLCLYSTAPVGSGLAWRFCASLLHRTTPAKLRACCCRGKGEQRH